MSIEITQCPNCNARLKDGLFGSVSLISEGKAKLINEFGDGRASGYCNKCSGAAYELGFQKYKAELTSARERIQKLIHHVPVISLQSPYNWQYEVLGMVTGQSVTGTGVFSEFTSSFTDLFGMQSGRYNQKIKAGEHLCAAQLRKQALDMGGNAVIATDIDYSEAGGEKGMLMVCMAGTAVKLNNISVLHETKVKVLEELTLLNERERYLSRFNLN